MNHADFRALAALFEKRFTQAELRRLLAAVPEGQEIVNGLPEVAPIASYAHDAADVIKRRGTYKTAKFWDVFEQAAGENEAQNFRDLRTRVGAPATAVVTQQLTAPSTAPMIRPAQTTSAQLTVLLVSASPDHEVRLRVDAEFRQIIDKFASTPARDQIQFVQINAARFEDLRAGLLRNEPHVLHISSHGELDGSLRFENRDTSGSQSISKRRLIDLLKELNDRLHLVVVNACHSQAVACGIPPDIDLAIGMNTEVSDSAAIDFAVTFYEALGYGKTVEKAFKIALTSLDDDECETPQLFPSSDLDSDNKRKLTLIPQ